MWMKRITFSKHISGADYNFWHADLVFEDAISIYWFNVMAMQTMRIMMNLGP